MILNLFRKKSAPEAVFAVYAAIVAQSRQARFYADWGVPDTVTGRFDMICLHLALVLRHLRGPDKAVGEFSQQLFDLFFKDMDRSLRELGAGDLSVPKKIQKMGNIFFGLLHTAQAFLPAERGDAHLVRGIDDIHRIAAELRFLQRMLAAVEHFRRAANVLRTTQGRTE